MSVSGLPLAREPGTPTRWLTEDGRFVIYRGTERTRWLVWINVKSASARTDYELLLTHGLAQMRFASRLEALLALERAVAAPRETREEQA